MSDLAAITPSEIHAACQSHAAEIAIALGRVVNGEFTIQPGEPSVWKPAALPSGADGPGLVVLMKFGAQALAAVLPQASGMLPDWYAQPDSSGEAKLIALAEELGKLLVPPTLSGGLFIANAVTSVEAALNRAGVEAGAPLVPLALAGPSRSAQLTLIWPLAKPMDLFSPIGAEQQEAAIYADGPDRDAGEGPDFSRLPGYARSLLKIRVPISVHLASKKETVQEVVSLAPGSIIKFEKGCDEMLRMVIGQHSVAEGEAVKIGDKFGFRITSMLLPREHFLPVRRPKAS